MEDNIELSYAGDEIDCTNEPTLISRTKGSSEEKNKPDNDAKTGPLAHLKIL